MGFDELTRETEGLHGSIDFLGIQLPLSIFFDYYEWSLEEQSRAVELAREQFTLLTDDWHDAARLQAAREIVDAVFSQADCAPNAEDVEELVKDMKLKSLDFTYSADDDSVFPYLSYTASTRLPDYSITIQFSSDLDIDEVALNDRRKSMSD